jgi:aspartate/methionine/tyrosine aminotransferase
MNPLAVELNQAIEQCNPQILAMLSGVGKQLYFPKGILSQSAEAKEKAHRINATIGIAKEAGHTMVFDTVMASVHGIRASQSLTYAPSFGIPALRQQWQQEIFTKNPSLKGKSISLPVVTCGVTHGISVFADLWLDPGDMVILPQLTWGNYHLIFQVRKGTQISSYDPFDSHGGYNLKGFEAVLRKEAQARKKITVLLNFPQNPTGYSLSKDEAQSMVNLLTEIAESGTQIIAVLDDAYFGLFYEEKTFKESLFAPLCGKHPNLLAVKLDGGTKEHFIWGLRIGFITYGVACQGDPAPVYAALEKKSAGCVRSNISNASHLSQTIMLNSMRDPKNLAEREEKFMILQHRAMKVKQVLADLKYQHAWDVYPFNSGYFMCLRLKTVEAETLRLHLLDRYGVGLISLGRHELRVAFSCIDEDQIQELFDTVLQGVKDLETMT